MTAWYVGCVAAALFCSLSAGRHHAGHLCAALHGGHPGVRAGGQALALGARGSSPAGGHGGPGYGLAGRLLGATGAHGAVRHPLHPGVHPWHALVRLVRRPGLLGGRPRPRPRHPGLLLRGPRVAGLGYPGVGRHAGVLRPPGPRHPVVGGVAGVALAPLRVALGVAALHLWVHLWVARVGLLGLLLGVCRVLPRVAPAVVGVLPGPRPAPLLVVALWHRLARVPVHTLLLLLHLLLLLPRHVGRVLTLLPGVPWLPWLALVSWVALPLALALGGPPATRGVARGATRAIGTIARGELAPLAPSAPVPRELLAPIPLAHLLWLPGVALHLLGVPGLLALLLLLLLLLLEVFGAPGTKQL